MPSLRRPRRSTSSRLDRPSTRRSSVESVRVGDRPEARAASAGEARAPGWSWARRHHLVLPHLRLGAGVFVSAMILAAVGAAAGEPLLIAPLLATAALKHTAPRSPGVAPHRVVGGHLLGALTGMGVGAVFGVGPVALGAAAAVAAVLMLGLDVLHAPGVATAYIAVQQHGDHWFPVQVVLAGAAVLVATTVFLSPLLHGQAYPVRAPRQA
jgi:CBS-domain-containing membrane protein